MESCYRMKPLILLTAMTVIGLFGIIGTVEYSHADHPIDRSKWNMGDNYFESPYQKTSLKLPISFNVLNTHTPHGNSCFFYDHSYQVNLASYYHFMALNSFQLTTARSLENITMTTDDSIIFGTHGNEGTNLTNINKIVITWQNNTTHTIEDRLWISDFPKNIDTLRTGIITIELFGENITCTKKLTINIIDSIATTELKEKLDNQKDKLNDKIEQKNKWKERYNTCFDNKENFKTELSELQSNFDETQQELSTYEGMYNTLETVYNESLFTIEKLKQEKADLIKKVETLETQLQEN